MVKVTHGKHGTSLYSLVKSFFIILYINPNLCLLQNGLYLSSHVDENDVQTIAHKCDVVRLHDSKNTRKTKSTEDADSDLTNNNIFWCLGTYDPLTETFPSDND